MLPLLCAVHATSRVSSALTRGKRNKENPMRPFMHIMMAISLLTPPTVILSASTAQARNHDRHRSDSHSYREWRGKDGRTYCRRSDGTTGLVIGAVGGALLGRTIDSSGDRTAGTLLGAAAGGLLGQRIDSRRRCQ
jgi:Glycine zipper 2TM domain